MQMRLVCFSDLRRLFDLFRSAHPFDNEAFHMHDGVLFQKNIDMKNLESNNTLQRGCCLFNYSIIDGLNVSDYSDIICEFECGVSKCVKDTAFITAFRCSVARRIGPIVIELLQYF